MWRGAVFPLCDIANCYKFNLSAANYGGLAGMRTHVAALVQRVFVWHMYVGGVVRCFRCVIASLLPVIVVRVGEAKPIGLYFGGTFPEPCIMLPPFWCFFVCVR